MTDNKSPELQFEPSPSLNLGGGGWLLIGLGVFGAVMAFFMNVGVDVSLTERVANVDKVAIRHMTLNASLAIFVSGWVLVAAGAIEKAVRRR